VPDGYATEVDGDYKVQIKKRSFGIAFGLFTLLSACGSSSSGGSSSNAGSGSTASASTATKDGKFWCAKDTCELPDTLKGEELCCIDPFKGGCGIKAGANCRPYPKTDDRCSLPDLVANQPGGMEIVKGYPCCTSGNECGVDFGMGCQPTTFLCSYISKEDAAALNPKTCDGAPVTLPANCGANGRAMIPGVAGSGS
jgi:hypothetical protein